MKVGGCNMSGAVGESKGMLPQKILESKSLEMPFLKN